MRTQQKEREIGQTGESVFERWMTTRKELEPCWNQIVTTKVLDQ